MEGVLMDYIKWIRSKVGKEIIILSFSVACISNEKGEILLQKRDKEKDMWGLPRGALELGESAEEAAIRETFEETGLVIAVKHLIGLYSKYFNEYPNGDKAQTICYSFKVDVIGGEFSIDNKETFGLEYFSKDNLPNIFTKQHSDMINDFFQGKTGVYK